jgi:hypothetical protein
MILDACTSVDNNIGADGCNGFIAGVYNTFYIANSNQVASVTASGSVTDPQTFDTFTMAVDALAVPYFFYKITMGDVSGSVNFEKVDGANGNSFFTHTVTLTVLGLTANTLAAITKMTKGRSMIIAKSMNNSYLLAGRVNGLKVTTITGGTGTAAADLYGATITFQSNELTSLDIVANGTTIDVWDGTAAVSTVLN